MTGKFSGQASPYLHYVSFSRTMPKSTEITRLLAAEARILPTELEVDQVVSDFCLRLLHALSAKPSTWIVATLLLGFFRFEYRLLQGHRIPISPWDSAFCGPPFAGASECLQFFYTGW